MGVLSEMIRSENERAAADKREAQQRPTGHAVPWEQVIAATFGTTPEPDKPTTPDSWVAYFKHQDEASS